MKGEALGVGRNQLTTTCKIPDVMLTAQTSLLSTTPSKGWMST